MPFIRSSPRRIALLFLLTLAIAQVFGFVWQADDRSTPRNATPEDAPATQSTLSPRSELSSESTSASTVGATHRTARQAPDQPNQALILEEREASALLGRARNGDPRALSLLHAAVEKCEGVPRDADSLAFLVSISPPDSRDARMRLLSAASAACAGLRAVVDEQVEGELLERAAELGDHRAAYLYGMTQMARIKTSGTTLEEIQRFRSNAQRFLQAASDAGESKALYHIGRGYERGEAFKRDPISAAAYYGAYLQLKGGNSFSFDRVMRSLSEVDQARARELQQQVLARFVCHDCP